MNKLLAEFIGTALLIVLGDGVVANVVLNKSKGHNSGWMVIATGWGWRWRSPFIASAVSAEAT